MGLFFVGLELFFVERWILTKQSVSISLRTIIQRTTIKLLIRGIDLLRIMDHRCRRCKFDCTWNYLELEKGKGLMNFCDL